MNKKSKKYMSKVKLGCSPGSDAITGEHVPYAANTNIVLHLCQLFTVCFKNGIVPTKFKNGILISILKKATLDPTIEKTTILSLYLTHCQCQCQWVFCVPVWAGRRRSL